MYKWCVRGGWPCGKCETLDEAEETLRGYGLQPTSQRSCDDNTEYWSEDGEMDEDDDGAYASQIIFQGDVDHET